MRRPRWLSVDTIIALGMIAAGLALFIETRAPRYQDMGVGTPFSPVMYPRLLLFVWLALAALLLMAGVLQIFREAPPARDRRPRPGQFAGGVACIGGYVWAFQALGFALATMIFTAIFLLLQGEHRIGRLAAFAVLAPLVTWYIFDQLLSLPLPTSPWSRRI